MPWNPATTSACRGANLRVSSACRGCVLGVSRIVPRPSPGVSVPFPRRVPSRSQYLARGVERLPHRLGPPRAPPRTSSRATPGPLLGRIGELRRVGAVVPHRARQGANLELGRVRVQRHEVRGEAGEVNVGGLAGRARSDLDHFGDVNEMVVTCIDVGIDLLASLVGQSSASPSRSAIARSRSFAACW